MAVKIELEHIHVKISKYHFNEITEFTYHLIIKIMNYIQIFKNQI